MSDVDLVLHVRPMADGSIHATMFDQANVLEAFEKGKKALDDAGKSNLPVWVSPKPETNWRQVGSGFGKHAIWSVTMTPDGTKDVKDGNWSTEIQPLSIAQAKMAVAAKYDVSPENVEIIVRG